MTLCDHGHANAHADPACPGPIVNIAFRVVDPDRSGHVLVDVFVGRRHTARGKAGRIVLRVDEWEEIRDRIKDGDPIELGLTT